MKQAHNRGERFILRGDFHEILMSAYTLKIIYVLGNITRKLFSTTKIGQKRIGYILASPEIHRCIKKVGYLPFDCIIYTNHCGMYLDLDTKIHQSYTIQNIDL